MLGDACLLHDAETLARPVHKGRPPLAAPNLGGTLLRMAVAVSSESGHPPESTKHQLFRNEALGSGKKLRIRVPQLSAENLFPPISVNRIMPSVSPKTVFKTASR